ncbi:MBOAT family O-acyltransferase [Nonlabens sp. Asnod2-A12]|uniref:MBOAT family O-acyltransferase n=1 Tax=Nonlabens sp. Asnod2-A12 TaxID=3160578 RepID=UPI00386CA728
MFFNSIDFAIFFPIIFILYWLVAKHTTYRNILILTSSYIFYGWWDWRFLILILFSSVVDYILGLLIHNSIKPDRRKLLLIISLCTNLGLLVYFKYFNFFIESFKEAYSLFGNQIEVSTLNIILPVGISFYTFQTLSYTIDVYREKLKPTKNVLAFFSFVTFFPQLVAGPIERASHLLPQFLITHKFEYNKVKSGLLLILFGLFKKMVIADRAAILVNQVFNNPSDHYGVEVIIASVMFAFQIYCDFSGYSDIAIGASRMLGFDLMKNFDSPYFSKSITEFWRRWHISLSTWFRDYVYIPLGGSKKGSIRMYFNLFLVFLISGLWHGAAATFIVWGAFHGILIVIEKYTSDFRIKIKQFLGLSKSNISNKLFYSFITFSLVTVGWIFFRANNMPEALQLISTISLDNYFIIFTDGLYELGLDRNEFIALIIAIIALCGFEIFHKRKNAVSILNQQPMVFRWIAYLSLVMMVIIYGVYGDQDTSQFIYFQF